MNTPDKVKADRPFKVIQIVYIRHLPITKNKLYAYTFVDT